MITVVPNSLVMACMTLMEAMLDLDEAGLTADGLERLFMFCCLWTYGAVFDSEARNAFGQMLRDAAPTAMPPLCPTNNPVVVGALDDAQMMTHGGEETSPYDYACMVP